MVVWLVVALVCVVVVGQTGKRAKKKCVELFPMISCIVGWEVAGVKGFN